MVLPTAETVQGTLPTTTARPRRPATRRPARCSSSRRAAAGATPSSRRSSNGTIGPDLDKLPAYAKTAGQPLDTFAHESIQNPSAYVEKGYSPTMPDFGQTLSPKQISDLVAYVTQPGG